MRLLMPFILCRFEVFCFALTCLVSQAYADILHVNSTVTSSGDGQSWGSELKTMQEALLFPDGPHTIKIAAGTYYVDEGLSGAATREDTFFVEFGTTIFAGYPTTGNPGEGDRNPLRYPVILSGDIDRATNPDGDYAVLFANPGSYEPLSGNSLHVMVIDDSATVSNTLISGATVQGGNADGGYDQGNGGGIYCGDGSPFIRNCVIQYNRAKLTNVPSSAEEFFAPHDGLGGGLYWHGDGLLEIRDTSFHENHAWWGGGLYVYPNASAFPQNAIRLVGCRFLNNNVKAVSGEGSGRGGGADLDHGLGFIDIINCDFTLNAADSPDSDFGGAAALLIGRPTVPDACSGACSECHECHQDCVGPGSCPSMDCESCPTNVVVTNTIFRANIGRDLVGGAIRLNRKTEFNNCLLIDNVTESIVGGAMVIGHEAFVQFNHTIIWDNSVSPASGYTGLATQVWIAAGKFDAAHSVIQGLSDPQFPSSPSPDPLSPGNIEIDPEFVIDPHPGTDGVWGTSDDALGNLRLRPDSPCIDAGDDDLLPPDASDIDESTTTSEDLPLDLPYRARSVDGECGGGDPVVDMGAYEYWCLGDLNGDCAVNGMDSALLLSAWNTNGYFPCPLYELEDLDRNCKVDSRDLALLLAEWGDCPEVGGGEGAAAPFGAGEESGEDEVFAMLWQWYVEENWAALLEWAISQLPSPEDD